MSIRRLTPSDLVFGEPLRWDVFRSAETAKPLLQKGQVVAPGPQLEGWLAEGLYAEAAPVASVLQILNQINKRLEQMLMDLRGENSPDAELRRIATELIAADERARTWPLPPST